MISQVGRNFGQRKDRTSFSDGLVYVSGPGYVKEERDVTVFEENTWLSSPGEGATSFRMLYVDGYTGSMRISRNAVVDANAYQGFMVCSWYGHSLIQANALQLGDASWGDAYDIATNCDGNRVATTQANLVLSDESSRTHQPAQDFVDQYLQLHDMVCAASIRASAPCPSFLLALNDVITKLGGPSKTCAAMSEVVFV